MTQGASSSTPGASAAQDNGRSIPFAVHPWRTYDRWPWTIDGITKLPPWWLTSTTCLEDPLQIVRRCLRHVVSSKDFFLLSPEVACPRGNETPGFLTAGEQKTFECVYFASHFDQTPPLYQVRTALRTGSLKAVWKAYKAYEKSVGGKQGKAAPAEIVKERRPRRPGENEFKVRKVLLNHTQSPLKALAISKRGIIPFSSVPKIIQRLHKKGEVEKIDGESLLTDKGKKITEQLFAEYGYEK